MAGVVVAVGVVLYRAASNDWLKNWPAAWKRVTG